MQSPEYELATLISLQCVFHILHGSISQFDILLHGQLASHNAQSATELGVRGRVRSSPRGNETEAEAARQKKKKKGMDLDYFKAHFIVMDQR